MALAVQETPPKGRRGIGLDQKTEDRIAGTPTLGGPQEEDEAKKTEKEASEGWDDPGVRKVGFQTVKGCQDVRKEGQRVWPWSFCGWSDGREDSGQNSLVAGGS